MERDIEVATPVELQEIRSHKFILGVYARSMGFCCSPSCFQFLRHLLATMKKQISLLEKTGLLSVIFKLKIKCTCISYMYIRLVPTTCHGAACNCYMYKCPTNTWPNFATQRRRTCDDNGDDDNDKGGDHNICLVGFYMSEFNIWFYLKCTCPEKIHLFKRLFKVEQNVVFLFVIYFFVPETGLQMISGESPDTMTGQIHFNSVTYRFWLVKLYS